METADVARQLTDLGLLSNCSPEEAEGFVRAGEVATLGPGEVVISEGEEPRWLLILLAGTARVTKRGHRGFTHELATVGGGSILGEVGLLGGGRRSATVRTTEPVTLFRLPRPTFWELFDGGQPAARRLLAHVASTLASRQHRANERLVELLEQADHPNGTVRLSVEEIREKLLRVTGKGL